MIELYHIKDCYNVHFIVSADKLNEFLEEYNEYGESIEDLKHKYVIEKIDLLGGYFELRGIN
jgi:hypothetical protein